MSGCVEQEKDWLLSFQEFSDFLFQSFLKPRFTPHVSTIVLSGIFLYLFFLNLAHGIPPWKNHLQSVTLYLRQVFYQRLWSENTTWNKLLHLLKKLCLRPLSSMPSMHISYSICASYYKSVITSLFSGCCQKSQRQRWCTHASLVIIIKTRLCSFLFLWI